MTNAPNLEERLAKVEHELAELKNRVTSPIAKSNWISDMVGRFEDDPVFEEITRLGKKIRDAEEPDDSVSSEARGG